MTSWKTARLSISDSEQRAIQVALWHLLDEHNMNLWNAARVLDVPIDLVKSIFNGMGRPKFRALNSDERHRLALVVRELVDREFPVSISEIAATIGASTNFVASLLEELERAKHAPVASDAG